MDSSSTFDLVVWPLRFPRRSCTGNLLTCAFFKVSSHDYARLLDSHYGLRLRRLVHDSARLTAPASVWPYRGVTGLFGFVIDINSSCCLPLGSQLMSAEQGGGPGKKTRTDASQLTLVVYKDGCAERVDRLYTQATANNNSNISSSSKS